jgi:hypothetical protein
MERKVLFDVFNIRIRNKGGLPETTFAFAVLALQQVTCALFAAQYLPRSSDFEALGYGFPCLCFSSDSWHGAAKLSPIRTLASQKSLEDRMNRKRLLGNGFTVCVKQIHAWHDGC